MQTRKNANLAPESFRRSTVPRRLKHRARRRRRILCLLPVILVFGVLAAALLRFTPALAYAERLSGVPLYRLKSYIDNNTPVMIWATICMEPPIESDIWTVPETGREITWVYPMHALILTGYDENGYYFSDPLAGQDIYYGKDSVEVAYTALFEQAIILTN